MAVFCYSPAVWVYIKSLTSGQIYDVSPDMVRGQTVLRENAPHQMQVTLMNKQRRYDKLFVPNDLFVVYMKRTRRLLCMSGYLDSVPWFSAWESSVQLFGTCTAKRLLQKRWDPGTIAALNLMSSTGVSPQSLAVDGGMRDKAIGLLTQVGGWPQDTIHIAALPTVWMQKVAALFSAASPLLFKTTWDNIGGTPSLKGNNPMVGSASAPQSLPKGVSSAEAAYFNIPGGGQAVLAVPYSGTNYDIAKPKTPYYCQMNWGYLAPGQGKLKNQMKAWLAANPPPGAGPLMVYCPTTNKTVLCEIAGDGPGHYNPNSATVGLSPQAISTLGITTKMLTQDVIVYLAWCDQSESKDRYPPGPWPVIETVTIGNGKSSQAQGVTNIATQAVGVQGNPFDIPTVTGTDQSVKVVAFVRAAVGKSNYVWGDTGQITQGKFGLRPSYDCSGLAYAAWKAAGLDWPRLSCDGYWQQGATGGITSNVNIFKDQSKLIPGDLVFYWNTGDSGGGPNDPNHMGIYIGTDDSGNPQTVQASDPAEGVHIVPLNPGGDIQGIGYGRPSGYPGFQNLGPAGSGAGIAYGSGVTAPGAAGTNTSFINYWDWFGQPPAALASIATGVLGLLNDQPFLPFVNTVLNSSMRSWCTAPNGDFISWFPDYFGAYGMTASITIEDVELQDFSIAFSDQNMVTHQYVTSTWVSSVFGPSPAGQGSLANIAMTDGIVTLEMGNVSNLILQTILGLPNNDTSGFGDPQKLLNRFGARPNFQQIGVIMGPGAQFFYALFLFALNWASMFTTNIPITFMPEVFPGMLLRTKSQGLQVYVNQVVHAWDLTDGGPGFTTQVAVMAPSDYTKGGGLYGLGIPTGGSTAVI